jgi:probable F420-dependent oxidoreductase
MHLGIAMFPDFEAIQPGPLAALCERRGFESLFFPEHPHIPVGSLEQTPFGRLPAHYARTYDPFVALTAAACATTRLRIGTGICLVTERDPIVTAKEVASIDHLSGGRFLFGIGAGWNEQELVNHGTDPASRFGLMRERVLAMKEIWAHDEASYTGAHVRFSPIWSWPKPLQEPHPPILIGGNGPKVLDRVLAYGDEWLPEAEDGFLDRVVELHERAAAAGRKVATTVWGADPAELAAYAAAGAHRAVFWVQPRAPADVEAQIDDLLRATRA